MCVTEELSVIWRENKPVTFIRKDHGVERKANLLLAQEVALEETLGIK